MKKLLGVIVLGLLLNTNIIHSEITSFHNKSDMFKMIDDEVTGVKLNWGPEKKPPKIKVDLPNNSPLLISDYHSIWGASGGRRTWEGKNTKHHGVDFYVKAGDSIIAANSGKVLLTTFDACAGPIVVIKHPGNKYAYYLHVGEFKVKKGDKVERGQVIADAGAQISTKCGGGIEHLHFQISSQGPCKSCWGTWVLYGDPKNYRNPHKYWTGGKGKPECFVEGKEFHKKKLTLPVICKIL